MGYQALVGFHSCHSQPAVTTNSNLKHVLEVGNAITVKERRRKLFTNKSDNGYRTSNWSHVVFEHPATSDTSALEPNNKEEIIKDLITFTKVKDYYTKWGIYSTALLELGSPP
ncbi:AAA-ATPase 1 [Forsythia ovata]|uniref:AAA-ATPase 1 n=1 Tax=Forsythia ovata TaxID=205694 RepID=A0ABD1UTD7_9LAMI